MGGGECAKAQYEATSRVDTLHGGHEKPWYIPLHKGIGVRGFMYIVRAGGLNVFCFG